MKTSRHCDETGDSHPLDRQFGLYRRLCTLDEVDEHLQVSDLGFELIHQLLFDPGWVHYLSDGSVHSLS